MNTELETIQNELASLKIQMAVTEAKQIHAARRARVLGGFGLAMLGGTVVLMTLKPVGAQGGYGPTLTSLQNQVNTVLTRTQFLSADSATRTSKFVGCNVYIQSGSGSTDDNVSSGGTLTGLGNLTIGYNSLPYNPARSGSHNLILGDGNNYTSYGGIVAGNINSISAPYASVSGGSGNSASGVGSSVSAGNSNTASGAYASVSGGLENFALGTNASVSGGGFNEADDSDASVSGGGYSRAQGLYGWVGGGYENQTSGFCSAIYGGYINSATGSYASVGGGSNNTAGASYSTVSGGEHNRATGASSAVAGGRSNTASGADAAVLGGYANTASGFYSIVCGGYFCGALGNNPNGDFTANLGGFGINISAQYGHNP